MAENCAETHPTRLRKMNNLNVFVKVFLEVIVKPLLVQHNNYIHCQIHDEETNMVSDAHK